MLYQFFVYPALTDEIEDKIIKPLAKIYRDNNYSLVEPLKVLFKSEHFFNNQIENSLIKSPIEFSMSILKEINLVNDGVFSKLKHGNEPTIFHYLKLNILEKKNLITSYF